MCNTCLDCTDIQIPEGAQGATGPQGPAGTNGTDGVDGTTVLHNDISDSATTGTSLETLKTYTLPADTLDTDGSYIKIIARFSTSTATTYASTKAVSLVFNGTTIANNTFIFDNVDTFEQEVIISRYSNTSGRTKFYITNSNSTIFKVIGASASEWSTLGGLNFTTTAYDIQAKGNSDVTGDITCESLIILKYEK